MKKFDESVLSLLTVNESRTHLKQMSSQYPDMVTDGSWAIRRSRLAELSANQKHIKVPAFLLTALCANINPETKTTFDELFPLSVSHAVAMEMANVMTGNQKLPLIRFDQVDYGRAGVESVCNGYSVKLLQELFPGADWFSLGDLKPMYLAHNGEILAALMPIATNERPGFCRDSKDVKKTDKNVVPV